MSKTVEYDDEVNMATLTCWRYYHTLNIGLSWKTDE